jgi:hypothetical protein
MIGEIKQAIIELEKKHYKIEEIKLSEDILKLLANSFNNIYGENAIELNGINTLFGYEVSRNLFDESPVVFRTSIKIEDVLRGDK